MTSTTPVLRVVGLSKRFGPTVALEDVHLVAEPGEVHAIVGENGAGKSTLMNIVSGGMRPEAGGMYVDGRPYEPASPHDGRRRGVALIHQELALCAHLTVAENILLGQEPARRGVIDRAAMRARAAELLAQFGHGDIDPDTPVARLPLAARQVVEICRALACNARVLLMDEPTSSLPRSDVEHLFALVRRLAATGIGVLYISHFLEEVREIADRVTVLRDGRTVDSGSISERTNDEIIASMVGRSMSGGGLFPPRERREPGAVVLEVRGLASPPVLREASFALHAGEILGIAGLLGSGRTELVRALFGLQPATDGRILLRGDPRAARGARPKDRVRQGLGYLSEDRKGEGLALPLSIADNLSATRLSAAVRRWGVLDLVRQRDVVQPWIVRLGIRARSPAQPVRALSGGNQQKVAVGRLLFQDADVLLLDEPTRGVDIGSKAQLYEVIAHAATAGKAVLMVSSYLPELFGLCDRIAVMSRGRLSEAKPVGEWTPQSVLAVAMGADAVGSGSLARANDRSV